MRYTAQDIWDIFIANYRFNSALGFAEPDTEFDKQTTLINWISDCDLLSPKALAKSYYENFGLTIPYTTFETFFCQKNQTLWGLCEYLALYAKRPVIKPFVWGGKPCQTVAIFMTLKKQLANVGADTKNLRPGTKLKNYDDLGKLVNEVNKIAPNSLIESSYKDNTWVSYANTLTLLAIIVFFMAIIATHFFNLSPLWSIVALITVCTGVILEKIGKRFPPKTFIIGHCEDFRELTYRMQQCLNKNEG